MRIRQDPNKADNKICICTHIPRDEADKLTELSVVFNASKSLIIRLALDRLYNFVNDSIDDLTTLESVFNSPQESFLTRLNNASQFVATRDENDLRN